MTKQRKKKILTETAINLPSPAKLKSQNQNCEILNMK